MVMTMANDIPLQPIGRSQITSKPMYRIVVSTPSPDSGWLFKTAAEDDAGHRILLVTGGSFDGVVSPAREALAGALGVDMFDFVVDWFTCPSARFQNGA
jgi:hypothetical protein